MGVVVALSGLVGIGIPLMDHRFILLGFLLCWGSTAAILILYSDEWKSIYLRVFRGTKLPKNFTNGYLVASIFAVIYFVAPIIIYRAAPQYENYVTNYGPIGPLRYAVGSRASVTGPTSSKIDVDGNRVVATFGNSYKLMGIIYHHSHSMDSFDEPHISKSGLYDAKPEQITIVIPWNETFIDELVGGMSGTAYVLLAVPPDIKTDFDTVRQGLARGALLVQDRSGPP